MPYRVKALQKEALFTTRRLFGVLGGGGGVCFILATPIRASTIAPVLLRRAKFLR